MEVSIKINEKARLISRLEKKINDNNGILEKISLKIRATAKELCPVDTGRLRGSIGSRVRRNQVEVYTNVYYAPFVEFGTGIRGDGSYPYETDFDMNYGFINGQVAQPFLYPALKLSEEDILKEFKNKLKE